MCVIVSFNDLFVILIMLCMILLFFGFAIVLFALIYLYATCSVVLYSLVRYVLVLGF